MAKAFGLEEKELIRQQLIDACIDYWGKYGMTKTSVDELVKMVGISKGSFYLFYDTKEELFNAALDYVHEKVKAKIYEVVNHTSLPPKETFKLAIRTAFYELKKTPWILNIDRNELEKIIRRVPAEKRTPHIQTDENALQQILELLKIEINVPIEVFTSSITLLIISMIYGEQVGEFYVQSFELLLDGLVEGAIV